MSENELSEIDIESLQRKITKLRISLQNKKYQLVKGLYGKEVRTDQLEQSFYESFMCFNSVEYRNGRSALNVVYPHTPDKSVGFHLMLPNETHNHYKLINTGFPHSNPISESYLNEVNKKENFNFRHFLHLTNFVMGNNIERCRQILDSQNEEFKNFRVEISSNCKRVNLCYGSHENAPLLSLTYLETDYKPKNIKFFLETAALLKKYTGSTIEIDQLISVFKKSFSDAFKHILKINEVPPESKSLLEELLK